SATTGGTPATATTGGIPATATARIPTTARRTSGGRAVIRSPRGRRGVGPARLVPAPDDPPGWTGTHEPRRTLYPLTDKTFRADPMGGRHGNQPGLQPDQQGNRLCRIRDAAAGAAGSPAA